MFSKVLYIDIYLGLVNCCLFHPRVSASFARRCRGTAKVWSAVFMDWGTNTFHIQHLPRTTLCVYMYVHATRMWHCSSSRYSLWSHMSFLLALQPTKHTQKRGRHDEGASEPLLVSVSENLRSMIETPRSAEESVGRLKHGRSSSYE